MGNKKDQTKDQILEQSRKERIQRDVARKEYEAAAKIQKQLRSFSSNKNLIV
jgi:protein-arginine kinase activator protein McsA